MFERYSEPARRTLFFARYELTALGGGSIEPLHVLLALLREQGRVVGQVLAQWNVQLPELRRQLRDRAERGPKIPTSVEVPFADSTKRALNFAAEEADRLLYSTIEPEHLLLAILRGDDPIAAAGLKAYGMTLDAARVRVAAATNEPPSTPQQDPTEAALHIDRITVLSRALADAQPGSADARNLVDSIDEELEMLRMMLRS